MTKKLEDDLLYQVLLKGEGLQEDQGEAARWIERLTDEVAGWGRVIMKVVAACGRTGLQVESEDEKVADVICNHIDKLYAESKRKPNFWVATYGDRGLEVVHYHEERSFQMEVERVRKLHRDSFTYGNL